MSNIKEQIVKKEKELKILKLKLESQEVIYEDKNIKIIKWENKKFSDFPMPKGYDFAEYQDFCNLINDKKIEPKRWEVFVTKNLFQNKKYPLFGAFLDDGGSWCPYGDVLPNSNDDGRMVIKKLTGVKK